jgi:hypothetical protein
LRVPGELSSLGHQALTKPAYHFLLHAVLLRRSWIESTPPPLISLNFYLYISLRRPRGGELGSIKPLPVLIIYRNNSTNSSPPR